MLSLVGDATVVDAPVAAPAVEGPTFAFSSPLLIDDLVGDDRSLCESR